MRLLLDTHAFVWLAEKDSRLPKRTENIIAEADALFVSFATAWEYSLKRKKWPGSFRKGFEELMSNFPANCLDMPFETYRYAESLPLIHNDPFDRMLIAQALHEDLTLVTKDTDIRKYPVRTLW